jgi:hypothetical protein
MEILQGVEYENNSKRLYKIHNFLYRPKRSLRASLEVFHCGQEPRVQTMLS